MINFKRIQRRTARSWTRRRKYNFFTSFTPEQTEGMSRLAEDLATFDNPSNSDLVLALSGSHESLKSYGIHTRSLIASFKRKRSKFAEWILMAWACIESVFVVFIRMCISVANEYEDTDRLGKALEDKKRKKLNSRREV